MFHKSLLKKVLKGYAYEYGGDDKEGTKITTTVYSDYGNQSATATHIDAYGRTLETYTTDSAGNVVYHEQYLYETAVDNLYDRVTRTVKGETAEKDRITRQYTDQYGNLVKEETVTKNADGAEVSYATEYTYDYLGNRLTVKSPRAAAENWEGNLYSAQYEYDAAGQVTKTTDIYGNVTTAEYDGLGQMIRTADAEANAAPTPYYSTLTYDVLGRLLMRQDPADANTTAETRYDYDRNGNNTRTRVKNGASSYAETSTQYNWRGKPEKALTAGTDTAYFYDPAGNALRMYTGELENLAITGLDQASGADFHVTQYTYDTQNRVLSTTDALGKTESYLYDRNGNLMQTTDRKGQIIGYTYDALGNLTEKSARQNASAEKENIYTYTYNRFGQRTQMSGTDQTSDYLYDNLGRMIKETLTGGVTKEYTYDIANNRTGFVLRNGDETYPMSMQYTYDKLNRVSKITSGNILTDYTYNRNGAVSSEQIGDVTTFYQYNRAGWVTDLTSQTSAKTIQSHHYQYLPDGNVSAKESTVNAGTTNYSYLYDNAGRLTQEQIGSRQQAYQYDPYGNRSQMTVMDQESYSTEYSYDQNNRLLYEIKTTTAKSEQTTYQYDDNGNLSSWFKGTLEERAATPADESASYTYDAYNRLTDFSRSNSPVCHYGYNGDNLRIFKDVNGYIRKKSYWDGSTLAAEIQANVVYKYYHGLTGIMFSKTASVLSGYYYKNAHGDVTAVADGNQNVTQTYTYDAFGNQLSQSNNDTNPFRYCGEYFDTESNQIYLRNRYYDTATGRFITEDPILDGVNWYSYCGGNPVVYEDMSGLGRRYVRIAEGLNVRQDHNTNSSIKATLSFGTSIEYTNSMVWSDGYYWAQTTYNGSICWVASKYLRRSDPSINYIFGQGNAEVANKTYGNYTISYNGCELVAIYNALANLHTPKDFDTIIQNAESTQGVRWSLPWMPSVFGTKPEGIGILLSNYGHNFTTTTKRSEFNDLLSSDGTYILSYWTGKTGLSTIHTVMFICDSDMSIRVFNDFSRDTDASVFSSLDSYLDKQGNAIRLYKVE